jgi:fluoride ion exporter CrcB/FEX
VCYSNESDYKIMDVWLLEQGKFWISAEFFAVGLSSFLGVYIRVAIAHRFPLETVFGCDFAQFQSMAYDPFLHLYLSRQVLIPNIVGCFLMAFFISFAQPLSNVSVPLFKSLTTGLCGCITTFSTWLNYTVDDMLNQRWIVVFTSLMLEFWILWSAYTMGAAFSKLLQSLVKDFLCYYHKWYPSKDDKDNIRVSFDRTEEEAAEYDYQWEERKHILNIEPFSSSSLQEGLEMSSFDLSNPNTMSLPHLEAKASMPSPRGQQVSFRPSSNFDTSNYMRLDLEEDDEQQEAGFVALASPKNLRAGSPTPRSASQNHGMSRRAVSPFGSSSEHNRSNRFDALFFPSFDIDDGKGDDDGKVKRNDGTRSRSPSRHDDCSKQDDPFNQSKRKRKLLSAALSGNVASSPLTNMNVGNSKIVKLHHISGVIDIWREDGAATDTLDEASVLEKKRKSETNVGHNKTFLVVADGLEHKAAGEGDIEEGMALVKKPTILARTSTVMTLEKESEEKRNRQSSIFCTVVNFVKYDLLRFFQKHEFYVWASAFMAVAAGIWISLIVYDLDTSESVRLDQPAPVSDLKLVWLRSMALAPLGCWFRWGLTRIRSIKGWWPEMNPQTMIANLVAVGLACLLAVLIPSWTWYLPIVYGVCGSCSTVSTWIAEIHGLYFETGPSLALRLESFYFYCC